MHIEKHITFEDGRHHVTYSLQLGQYEAQRVAGYIWAGACGATSENSVGSTNAIKADRQAAQEVMAALAALAQYVPHVSSPPCLNCMGQGRIALGTTANKSCDICRGSGRRTVASLEVSSDVV